MRILKFTTMFLNYFVLEAFFIALLLTRKKYSIFNMSLNKRTFLVGILHIIYVYENINFSTELSLSQPDSSG